MHCSAVLSRRFYCIHRAENGRRALFGSVSALKMFRSQEEGCTKESTSSALVWTGESLRWTEVAEHKFEYAICLRCHLIADVAIVYQAIRK